MTEVDKNKRRSFSKFYDKHIDSLYRFVCLKVNSEAVAKDIVSESFTRLWDQIKAPTEVSNPRAYLYQVARNLVVDRYQSRVDKIQPELLVLESDDLTPEEEALKRSDIKRVREALSHLKGSYQDVLIFYYVEGRSVEDIARMKDKGEGAVRVMIHRALKALEKRLEL